MKPDEILLTVEGVLFNENVNAGIPDKEHVYQQTNSETSFSMSDVI